MIPTLFGITLITFLIVRMAPGDPLSLKLMFVDGSISPKALAQELAKHEDPLELPQWYQALVKVLSAPESPAEKGLNMLGKNTHFYFRWLNNLLHFNFGVSSKDHRSVMQKIGEALPITLTLNVITIFIVYFISIPLGIWSALRQSSIWDKVVMIKLFVLYALPEFWVATILLVFLAGGEHGNFFPLTGYISDGAENLNWGSKILNIIWHLILPITVYVYGSFAFLSRFSRTNFLEVIRQDYVRTARAKGLPERSVIWKHAFRNSLIPMVTLSGTLLPALLGGSVIIEQIFSIPGMGMLSFEAVLSRDYNVIMGIATISAFLTLVSLLISDLLYVWVDPRITFEGK